VRELMRSLWLKDDRGSDVVDDDRPKEERATGELRELRSLQVRSDVTWPAAGTGQTGTSAGAWSRAG
jgi:hypothetical protein